MSYEPRVNDYVIWKNKNVEGWIYFKDHSYVTIELLTRLKDEINYQACSLHRNERVLIVCHSQYWKQLSYVRSRSSIYEVPSSLSETKEEKEIQTGCSLL